MEGERDRETGEFGAMRSGRIVRAAVSARLPCHDRHPFDVSGHCDQRPFAAHRGRAAQQDLPEAARITDLMMPNTGSTVCLRKPKSLRIVRVLSRCFIRSPTLAGPVSGGGSVNRSCQCG